ncbi:MAG TPA: hypothetical protein VNS88_02040, partial [Nitrospiraceae bacterium]|nr:hypothetical protein [Nitrospiraceae bacterium]
RNMQAMHFSNPGYSPTPSRGRIAPTLGGVDAAAVIFAEGVLGVSRVFGSGGSVAHLPFNSRQKKLMIVMVQALLSARTITQN